jgi:sulfur relay (sulfurtransferase) DsrF/TusC family protein
MPNPNVLFIVSGDPRSSPRPAEAIRIAAGVGAWKKANITLYLRDDAVLSLSEFADEFIDEDNYTRYLPIVGEFGRPIYVQKNATQLSVLDESAFKFKEISDAELAQLAADSTYVVRF